MSTEGIVFKPEDFKKSWVQSEAETGAQPWPDFASNSSHSVSKMTGGKGKLKSGVDDPLAEFYAEAKAQAEHEGRAGVRP